MNRQQGNHHRRSIRLKDYDYSQPGAYYVTVCTWRRKCVFGRIIDKRMLLNAYGRIVEREWKKTMCLRPNIVLDSYVIMPNHFHGIMFVKRRGVLQYAPTDGIKLRSPSQTIGAVVRGFKSAVTTRINILRNTRGSPVWQRGFYDHIIRDDEDLNRIREYILLNPANWASDRSNSANLI